VHITLRINDKFSWPIYNFGFLLSLKRGKMDIDNFLGAREKLLVQYGNYYATDRRLIRYTSDIFGENMKDMYYAHINSIQFTSQRNLLVLSIGIMLLIFGIYLYIFFILGLIGIIMGLLFRKTVYTLIASSGEKWRIDLGRNPNSNPRAKKFISTMREHIKGQ
jgi:hypothetical protein